MMDEEGGLRWWTGSRHSSPSSQSCRLPAPSCLIAALLPSNNSDDDRQSRAEHHQHRPEQHHSLSQWYVWVIRRRSVCVDGADSLLLALTLIHAFMNLVWTLTMLPTGLDIADSHRNDRSDTVDPLHHALCTHPPSLDRLSPLLYLHTRFCHPPFSTLPIRSGQRVVEHALI